MMPSAFSCRLLAVLTIAGASALLLSPRAAHAQRYDDPAGRGDYRDGPGRGAPESGARPEEDDDGPPPPADPAYRGDTDYRRPPPSYRDEPRERGDGAEETAGPDSGPPDVSAFYEPLGRYGRWDRHPEHGYVWIPDNVDEDWRPYTRGGWAFTDEHGWYWASEEPWGWATYHYGRWAYDGDRHWFWVPGRVWGPAWVAWRYSDDYIGWAALPPGSHDRYLGEQSAFLEGPRFNHFWIFVRPRFFISPGVGRFVQPAYVAERIMPRTRPIGSLQSGGPRAFNAGIDVQVVERLSHRRVYPSRIVVTGSPVLARPSFGTVSVYRPRVWARAEPGIAPPMRGARGGYERRDFGGDRGAAAVPDHGYPSPGTPPSGGQPYRRSGGPGAGGGMGGGAPAGAGSGPYPAPSAPHATGPGPEPQGDHQRGGDTRHPAAVTPPAQAAVPPKAAPAGPDSGGHQPLKRYLSPPPAGAAPALKPIAPPHPSATHPATPPQPAPATAAPGSPPAAPKIINRPPQAPPTAPPAGQAAHAKDGKAPHKPVDPNAPPAK